MEFRYQYGAATLTARVEKTPTGYTVWLGERGLPLEAVSVRDGEVRLSFDGQAHTVPVAADGARRWVAVDGRTYTLAVPSVGPRARRGSASGPRHDALEAQMPGVVRQVLVAVGDTVAAGQTLVVLEAMKMEIRIPAPHAGRVAAVPVREGETVTRGQVLVDVLAQPA